MDCQRAQPHSKDTKSSSRKKKATKPPERNMVFDVWLGKLDKTGKVLFTFGPPGKFFRQTRGLDPK